jgi:uncharacterized membrane protein
MFARQPGATWKREVRMLTDLGGWLTGEWVRRYRQLAVLASLAFASLLCLGLLAVRMVYSDSRNYDFLAWNLFLAWLPLLCSLAAYNSYKRRNKLSWLVVAGCALAWLLFFPNAPYLLTDVMHLAPRPEAPLWFDVLLVVAFAWTGLFLGLASLLLMQALVRRAAGGLASWAVALGVLGLSGFGIYIGRFLRWNSWDLILSPAGVLADLAGAAQHPLLHARSLVFSGLFSAFLIAAYFMFVAVTHWQAEAPEHQVTQPNAAQYRNGKNLLTRR